MHQKNKVSFLNFPNVLETKCGQLKIELLMSFSWSCVWWFKRREYLNYNLTITSSNPQISVEQWHFNRPHFVWRMLNFSEYFFSQLDHLVYLIIIYVFFLGTIRNTCQSTSFVGSILGNFNIVEIFHIFSIDSNGHRGSFGRTLKHGLKIFLPRITQP